MWPAIAILAFVTLQRLAELKFARENTARLLKAGGHEAGREHYPLIVLVHAAWLATLWALAPGRPISWPLIGVFAVLQLARLWVIRSLGPLWTTRIIVLPGAPLVKRGPYRFMKHPNYAVVMAEIAVLPLAFGLPLVAGIFFGANIVALSIRVRAEERALTEADRPGP
ncbi:MAG: isoprenylcysteine carboxyl methyltransferase family protein [Sphingomonadaceae bacterium]